MSGSASSHPFTFFRGSTQIYPEQPKLRFASRDADILELRVPSGTLAGGDSVEVKYNGVRVFKGDVARRRVEMSGNSDTMEAVTVEGPWAKMARFVYRQLWNSGSGLVMSSRLVLNQTQAGNPQSLDSELLEVATAGASACGYTVAAANVAVSSQVLPSDECRDITVADAIRRELRLFPKAVCRFDYSGSSPALLIKKSGDAASYAASVPKTARTYDYDERPIDGVDLEIEAEGEIDGVAYRNIGHQTAGNTAAGNVNCLRVALQIRGFSSNTVRNTFKSVTEAVPLDLNNVGWWKQKHHRLANVPLAAIKSITDGTRSPSNYSRISTATAGELEAAGLHCEVSKFSCKVRIETEDDKEEDLCLVSHFLTTNAQGTAQDPKTYTWVESSDAEPGETVPSGLAAAILAERSGSLRGETMTIRLGDTFPKIGDICDGIPLQSFEVDCADLTASLAFGAAEHLSPEDMAALLSNFRNKCTTHSSTVRKTGKADDGGSKVEHGGIPPLSSTEFAPGTKSKTTIKSSSGNNSSGASLVMDTSGNNKKLELSDETHSITLDLADVASGCDGSFALREFKFKDKDGNVKKYHGLFCDDIDLQIGKTIKGVDISPSSSETVVTFIYNDGTTDTIHIPHGQDGDDGEDGEDGKDGEDGADGKDGADGYSPTATVTKNGSTATITITDKNGTTTATISDGTDGKDGEDGADGKDGANGANGVDGQDGVGILSISTGTATSSGGYTTTPVTVALTDGTTRSFSVVAKDAVVTTNTTPSDCSSTQAAVGSSTEAARADHVHKLPTTNDLKYGQTTLGKIFASQMATIQPRQLVQGNGIQLTVNGNQITISATGSGSAETSGYSTASGATDLSVADIRYDISSHQLQVKYHHDTYENGLLKSRTTDTAWQYMAGGQAVEETAGGSSS